MLVVVLVIGTASMSKIRMLTFSFCSTRGISSKDTVLSHSIPQPSHSSFASLVLIGLPRQICLNLGLFRCMSRTKAYQKQLLSSFTTLLTDVLLRMLSFSLETVAPEPPDGTLMKWNVKFSDLGSIALAL